MEKRYFLVATKQTNLGTKYIGQYQFDQKQGIGIFEWTDGRQYKGEWKDGKQYGFGIYKK
jgi:hypothetical protein